MEFADIRQLLDGPIRRQIVERSAGSGETLFRKGDAPAFMYYILSGEARLVRNARSGMEVIFQRTRKGFLAEASLDQPAYHCDGIVVADARLLAIPVAGFRKALGNEKIRDFWLRHLSNELRRARAHSERLALRSASDRILHFVETEGHSGKLLVSQSKKAWSAELGLTHEALYRALRAMSDAGILEVADNFIKVR